MQNNYTEDELKELNIQTDLNDEKKGNYYNYQSLVFIIFAIAFIGGLIWYFMQILNPTDTEKNKKVEKMKTSIERKLFQKDTEIEELPLLPKSTVKKPPPPKKKKIQKVRVMKGVGLSMMHTTKLSKDKKKKNIYRGGSVAVAGINRINANFYIPKGTHIPCSLRTRIVSSLGGSVACTVSNNIYSANGNVLLVEKGSTVTGTYKGGSLENGVERLYVVWEEIRTINNVVINIDSGATGPLGASGVHGEVDNHWAMRFGAATLLSLVEIAGNLAVAKISTPDNVEPKVYYGVSEETSTSVGDTNSTSTKRSTTPVISNSTTNGSNSMYPQQAVGALQGSMNIILQKFIDVKPTLYKSHGDRIGIYVAKDLDFSNVYKLRVKK